MSKDKSLLEMYAAKFSAGDYSSPEADTTGRPIKTYTDLVEVEPVERGHNASAVHVTRARVTKVEGTEDGTANADLRHFTYHLAGSKRGTWTPQFRQGISIALKDLVVTAVALLELHNDAVSDGYLNDKKVIIPPALARG